MNSSNLNKKSIPELLYLALEKNNIKAYNVLKRKLISKMSGTIRISAGKLKTDFINYQTSLDVFNDTFNDLIYKIAKKIEIGKIKYIDITEAYLLAFVYRLAFKNIKLYVFTEKPIGLEKEYSIYIDNIDEPIPSYEKVSVLLSKQIELLKARPETKEILSLIYLSSLTMKEISQFLNISQVYLRQVKHLYQPELKKRFNFVHFYELLQTS